ncbi:hypothetical protein N8654_01205 [Synechococcus sp. AH-601-B19]|nr:hypothetical protein [Synechococcus sp. AH-601-B19]
MSSAEKYVARGKYIHGNKFVTVSLPAKNITHIAGTMLLAISINQTPSRGSL